MTNADAQQIETGPHVSVQQAPAVKPPNEFNFDKPELWSTWIKRFERYMSVSNLSQKTEKEKVDLLCYVMGEKSEEVLKQILPAMPDSTTLEQVKEEFTKYFSPKKNQVFERYKFNSRIHKPEESIDSFVTALYTLAETCDYGTLRDELIRDRVVIGVRDTKTSERLQLIADLTLEKAITMARQAEIQSKEGKNLRKEVTERAEVNKISNNNKAKGKFPRRTADNKNLEQRNTSARSSQKNATCYRCGRQQHNDAKSSPAINSTCRKCNKKGHWDRACRSGNVRRVEEIDVPDDAAFLGAVSTQISISAVNKRDYKVILKILDFSREIDFIIDTGADITCVHPSCVPKRFTEKMLPSDRIIVGPDKKEMSTLGVLNVKLGKDNRKCCAKLYVVRDLSQNLLGKPEIDKLDLIKIAQSIELNKNSPDVLIKKYEKVFNGLGSFKSPLKIILKENVTPHSISVPRTVAVPLVQKLKLELDRLVKCNVIVPVDFPTNWCSPIVVVHKKDTDGIRLCFDLSKLNASIRRAVHPIPKVDVTLAKLKGAKVFSKLDARAGYHQVKLHKASQPLTTFITPFGRFMHTRLPFGVNCASDYFSKKFNDILSGIPNVAIHIDDVLIFNESYEEHTKTLDEVFKRLTNEGVTLNREKCVFAVDKVEFLGHEISASGIKVLPKRVSAITDFPEPRDKESLLQFLGAVNYVSKFIPSKSRILEPLNALLKNDAHFIWSGPQKRAFEEIKNCIQKAPILAHYDYSKNIVVQADASSYGLGAALMQERETTNREVVAYASRTLTPCEKRYSQIEKEALALAFATERFKDYITGVDITLETDHKPLLQIL